MYLSVDALTNTNSFLWFVSSYNSYVKSLLPVLRVTKKMNSSALQKSRIAQHHLPPIPSSAWPSIQHLLIHICNVLDGDGKGMIALRNSSSSCIRLQRVGSTWNLAWKMHEGIQHGWCWNGLWMLKGGQSSLLSELITAGLPHSFSLHYLNSQWISLSWKSFKSLHLL